MATGATRNVHTVYSLTQLCKTDICLEKTVVLSTIIPQSCDNYNLFLMRLNAPLYLDLKTVIGSCKYWAFSLSPHFLYCGFPQSFRGTGMCFVTTMIFCASSRLLNPAWARRNWGDISGQSMVEPACPDRVTAPSVIILWRMLMGGSPSISIDICQWKRAHIRRWTEFSFTYTAIYQ